jgi:superkiller protein 3
MNDPQIPPQAASYKEQADNQRDSGNTQAAIDNYRSALELAPNFWQAHANLSMLLAESGDHANSVIHAEKAVEIMPDMAELLDNLGVIYRAAGRYPEAINAHKQAVDKNPSLLSAWLGTNVSAGQ